MKTSIKNTLALCGAYLSFAIGLGTAHADEPVPFEAAYTSAITFTSPSTATLVGSGVATHLGATTDSGQLAMVGPASCDGGFAVHNVDTLTAANGDQLVITIDQQSCPVAPGIYKGVGSWVVSGGTGRFVGATGSGAFNGLGDFNVGTVHCALSGTIENGQ
jgi:hypothetical protein